MLTEGLGRLICAAQGTGGEVRAALGRSSAAGSKQGLSGLLDGTARPKAVLREGYGGSGRALGRRRRRNAVTEALTGGVGALLRSELGGAMR